MRVIYATSDLEDWIDVAINLKKNSGWKPICWITTCENEKLVSKSFNNIISINLFDAIRGNTPLFSDDNITLDEELIYSYSKYEKIAINMMDRIDPTGYSFNNKEREQLYYELLTYWVNAIKNLEPDLVVFSESPHGLFQYILYIVAVNNGIRCVRFTPTHIDGLTFLSSHIEESSKLLLYEYKKAIDNNDNSMREILSSYVSRVKGNYKDALPYYMHDINNKSDYIENILKNIKKIDRFLKNSPCISYKKSKKHSIKDNNITKIDLLFYKFNGIFIKNKLKKLYDKLSKKPNFNDNYIYVALHYQPEKTTSPEGGIFVNQWLMINLISSLLPSGWRVYVKEHNSQFSSKLYGEMGRSLDFYQNISDINNVILIDSNTSSFDLIDNCKAVATVTGTVWLEAIIRDKYVLSFGYAWYVSCKGIFDIKNKKDLEEALVIIENENGIDKNSIKIFLSALDKISLSCYLNRGNKAGVDIDKKTNVSNLSELLIRYALSV